MEILIAEDDATSRRMLDGILTKWGYHVTAVADGLEALDRLTAHDMPPIALLDWMMPGMDGVEVCRRLRQLHGASTPYIIMVTARANKSDIVAGLEAGANDYVIKPFDRDELRARVNAGARIVTLERELVKQIANLKAARAHIETLQGILPICMYCHKIKDDKESWQRIEDYLSLHSDMAFSHGLCPECMAKYHPELL
ncbi:MAG: response regulator transcription factor [Candidatus Hydrogenedentes bacterium]|nr:response regulator transcription factor [Candidatus Hydrogenedentota bacterium]